MKPLLSVVDVSFAYRAGATVCTGVSFELHAGEVCVLIGPNGAGKSTLLRLAAGLLLPDAGSVLLAGRDTRGLSRQQAARLAAFSPADLYTDVPLAVGQALADAAYASERAFFAHSVEVLERIRNAADEFEIEHLLERDVRELSTGERARLSLARALVQGSSLLLLDEPAGRLDYRHRERLLVTLRALAADGKGILMAEHNLEVAMRLADKVAALSAGRCLAAGAAGEIMQPQVLEKIYGVRFVPVAVAGSRLLLPCGLSVPAASDATLGREPKAGAGDTRKQVDKDISR